MQNGPQKMEVDSDSEEEAPYLGSLFDDEEPTLEATLDETAGEPATKPDATMAESADATVTESSSAASDSPKLETKSLFRWAFGMGASDAEVEAERARLENLKVEGVYETARDAMSEAWPAERAKLEDDRYAWAGEQPEEIKTGSDLAGRRPADANYDKPAAFSDEFKQLLEQRAPDAKSRLTLEQQRYAWAGKAPEEIAGRRLELTAARRLNEATWQKRYVEGFKPSVNAELNRQVGALVEGRQEGTPLGKELYTGIHAKNKQQVGVARDLWQQRMRDHVMEELGDAPQSRLKPPRRT
jgi:hypothetical protein